MPAKVISAFPGCGKSTYYKEWSQYSPENAWRRKNNGEQVYCHFDPTVPVGDKIIDSDSSLFSWIYDENGNKTDVRNPDFPNNYIQHIKDHLNTEDIIFVSSHKVVRDALRENGIDYVLVYPEKSMLQEFTWRYKQRGNTEEFIKYITDNWDNFIDEMDQETFPEKVVLKPWTCYDAITVTIMNDIMEVCEICCEE